MRRLSRIEAKVKPLREVVDATLKDDERRIGPYFVWWDDVSESEVAELQAELDAATSERSIQTYLDQHPKMLIQHLGGGHGRWVVPQARLGSEYVPDFLIGERSSIGYEWTAVELESPRAKAFNSRGDPSAALNHAVRQIMDWRNWLRRNQNYAARPRDQAGLGLIDIDAQLRGLIIIGRRDDGTDRADLRRRFGSDSGIVVHTFDWLVSTAIGRVEALRQASNDVRGAD